MNSKLLSVTVKGNSKTWAFDFYGDPIYLGEWRADGLEVVVIENVIPAWVPAKFVGLWCAVQDLWNFKNPWRR